MGRTFCVEALAWIAASRNQDERAAVLFGAATGLWQSIGTTLESHQPLAGHHRDCERQVRDALGVEHILTKLGFTSRAQVAAWAAAAQPDGGGA